MEGDKTYNGIFSPADSPGSGHLVIAGKDSALKLVTTKRRIDREHQDFHGLLANGKKASALQCAWTGSTEHGRAHYETNYFPHYVVLGETYLRTDDAVINAAHYHFENAHCLVSGYRTFQSLHPTPDEVRALLETEHRRTQEIAKEHNWGETSFDPEIGEYPHLLYFSGVWEIVKVEADIGTVSLHNRTSHNMGRSKGIWIKNQVAVTFRFRAPKTLTETTRALSQLHSLFELALGRRQRLLQSELETTHARQESPDAPALPCHDLYWSYCNESIRGETEPTHHADVLIAPERRPQEFAAVVSGWLNTAPAMGEARRRFATAFYGDYEIDRIVGAANMFDLLPKDRVPKTIEIDPETKEAVKKCRAIFKALPKTSARQSVLSELGRVGKPRLRDKVLHRAQIVQSASGGKFPDIHIPCGQAVQCRNHFVHGSEAGFDYAKNFGAFAFLTETLEFVFAISDLIELGWSFEKWCEHGLGMGTAFTAYAINYRRDLAELKSVLAASAAATSLAAPT